MIRSAAFLLCCLLIVSSCSKGPKEELTAVEMKQFLAESTPGCNADSMACARFEVNYPEFPGLDPIVEIKLQERFAVAISGGEKSTAKSMEAEGKEFIDDYNDFKKQTPDYTVGWYRDVSITLLLFNDSLLSLQLTDESYAGGAHGNYALTFMNVRPGTGAPFLLTDFLKPGYESELNRMGEEVFRKNRDLPDTASFEFNGYTFDGNHFALNENYGFSQEGISFYFNSYEIAPYALGPTEVLIPYDRIREWIK